MPIDKGARNASWSWTNLGLLQREQTEATLRAPSTGPKKPRMERGTFKPSYLRLVCAFPLGFPFKPQTKSTVCEYFLPPLRRDPWISEPGRYHRHRPPEHGRKKWTRFHRAARFKGWQHLEISTCQKLKLRFGQLGTLFQNTWLMKKQTRDTMFLHLQLYLGLFL